MSKRLALVFVSICLVGASVSADARSAKAPTPASLSTTAPHDPAADVVAAKALMQTGRSSEAAALLAPDHIADPSNRNVAVALAQAYSYSGRQGAAIAILDAVLVKDPTDGEARVLLGRAYAYNHDYADAEAQFAADLKQYPGDSDAQVGLAETYTFEAKYVDAEKLYQSVLANNPKNGDALVGLAAVESYTNRLDAARRDYGKVLDAHPGDVDALVGLASVAYWQGDLATAKTLALHVVELSPENGDAKELLRQVDLRVAPLTDVTSVTTTGSDGLQTNRQLIQRFYPSPSTYFGIFAARYQIGGGGASTSANRFGIVAGFSQSAAASYDLRAYSSTFTGQAATTDIVLNFSGTRGKNDYWASIVSGGVDGSIRANGGVPVLNDRSAVIRLTTMALSGAHHFGKSQVGLGLQHASYNDGNTFHDYTVNVNRTVPLKFGASMIADVSLRSAGFANTYSYSTFNPNPPYNIVSHSHGYYDYLHQQNLALSLTFAERFSDHFGGGMQVMTGTQRTTTFWGPSGPTGIFRIEPYFSLDVHRMTFSVDDISVRYSGTSDGFVLPYSANTLQLNLAVRL